MHVLNVREFPMTQQSKRWFQKSSLQENLFLQSSWQLWQYFYVDLTPLKFVA